MRSLFAILVLAVLAVGAYYLIDVDITKEARLPDVDVNVSGGQLPEATVKTGSIQVTEENMKVKVPDVDVKLVEKDVKLPGIKIKTPEESTN